MKQTALVLALMFLVISGCEADSSDYSETALDEMESMGLLHIGNSEPVDNDQVGHTDHDYRCECEFDKKLGCRERFGYGEGDELGPYRTRGFNYDCMNAPKCGGGERCIHINPAPTGSTPVR